VRSWRIPAWRGAAKRARQTASSVGLKLGRASGANTNVILKSGTNEFHGSAYEYLRIEARHWQQAFDAQLGLSRTGRHRSVGMADLLALLLDRVTAGPGVVTARGSHRPPNGQ